MCARAGLFPIVNSRLVTMGEVLEMIDEGYMNNWNYINYELLFS